ncbi:hypothetical protein J2Y45_003270 [Dyadobacter sp. BE34]|uniref:Uncharacterized protein n=1 Tax=Dyadobacter fermentans TaxID=94254 RepID=A0ABU1QYA5_9BACT|nr:MULTISPECIES: hypothetical protein [Dyadobacter]MDR6806078.1 hypothetical protein [Dyadobacter fermentans]MDR7043819.1 hypothetical protein [Dyadobacter sp. BE242]MDR7198130.1 hypothetical protein [Dyadobacter sp. BE34]MDR7216093.1 hypothetical protein [Dyadobacter sp. BE31]MDR7264381.1 hypothetical protein [Dyadobacter sp. BE32]
MNQQTLSESPDSPTLSYADHVKALLSMNAPADWIEDLWTIYTGFMIAQGELGHNPRASDLFCTFRELILFFQKLEERKAA